MASLAIDTITLLIVAACAWYLIRPDLWTWETWLPSRRDFFYIWGFKARLFLEQGGIDWSFLKAMPEDLTHRDYPLLVPLIFDSVALLAGGWDARLCGAMTAALAFGALLIARGCLGALKLPPVERAAGTLALTGATFLPWAGFGDGPLVAFAGAGALLLASSVRERVDRLATLDSGAAAAGAVLLGLGTQAKNEGLAFLAAIALATIVLRRYDLVRRLWPAALIALPWLLARAIGGFGTDLFSGDAPSRIAKNLGSLPQALIENPPHQSAFVAAIAIVLFLRRRQISSGGSMLLITAGLQILFYLAAYALSPFDAGYHVLSSWSRLTSHLLLIAGFAAVTACVERRATI
jgi:hypothetical protein